MVIEIFFIMKGDESYDNVFCFHFSFETVFLSGFRNISLPQAFKLMNNENFQRYIQSFSK